MTLATAFLVLAASAAVQESRPLDPFRDIVVRGAVTYAADDIVHQLAFDGAAWTAMRSTRGSAAAVLAERVREGYRKGGFMDADVTVSREGGRIVLQIDEGPRARCGVVRVTGNRRVDANLVVGALVQPEKPWDGWTAGSVARGNEATLVQAWRRVVATYEAAGVAGTRGSVAFVRSGETVDLQVQVEEEGHEVRVGKVVLAGERVEDREAVLALLPVVEGEVYTSEVAARLRAKLDDLGRYVQLTIPTVASAVDGYIDPFTVRCEPARYARKITAQPDADVAQVRRGFDWLRQQIERGTPVRVTISFEEAEPAPPGIAIGPGSTSLEVSVDGVILHTDRLRFGQGAATSLDVLLSSHELVLADGCGSYVDVRFATPAYATFSLETTPDSDDGMSVSWGIGKSTETQVRFRPKLHPLTATYAVYGSETPVARDGDDLTWTSATGESMRIARDGAVTLDARPDATRRISLGGPPFAQQIAAIRARLTREGASQVSIPSFVAGWFARAATADAERGSASVSLLLQAAVEYAAASASSVLEDPSPPPQFTLTPAASESSGMLIFALWAAFKFSQPFGDTWPAIVLRALPDLIGGEHRQAALQRLHRLSGDEATGPIALTITHVLFRKIGAEEHANFHLKTALARCDFDHTFGDLLTLAPEGTALRPWLLGLGRHWRDRAGALPPPDGVERDDLASLRAGLRVLWDGGLGSSVREAVASAKPRQK